MFEFLRQYDRIIVSGPQRSGTNICARMIAQDTGHIFITAQSLGVNDIDTLHKRLPGSHTVVVHGPGFSRYAHTLFPLVDCVVFMRRDLDEIFLSQERIDWHGGAEEINKYLDCPIRVTLQSIFGMRLTDEPDRVVAAVKYVYWELYQRQRTNVYFEVDYNRLAEHPLWLPKDYYTRLGIRGLQSKPSCHKPANPKKRGNINNCS